MNGTAKFKSKMIQYMKSTQYSGHYITCVQNLSSMIITYNFYLFPPDYQVPQSNDHVFLFFCLLTALFSGPKTAPGS